MFIWLKKVNYEKNIVLWTYNTLFYADTAVKRYEKARGGGSGNLRYFGALNASVAVSANTVPLFKPNTINISLDAD